LGGATKEGAEMTTIYTNEMAARYRTIKRAAESVREKKIKALAERRKQTEEDAELERILKEYNLCD